MKLASPIKTFLAFGSATLIGLFCVILFVPLKGQPESFWRNLVSFLGLLSFIFGSIGTAASLVWLLVVQVGRRTNQNRSGACR